MLHCLCTSLLVGAGVSEGCFVQHVEPAPQLSENERYEKLIALCHMEKREIPFFSPGDLLYLDITTLEGQELYITACPSGFYLNKSTSREVFDPSPRKLAHHSTHLVGLLSQVRSVAPSPSLLFCTRAPECCPSPSPLFCTRAPECCPFS